jgi:ribosomal protein L23
MINNNVAFSSYIEQEHEHEDDPIILPALSLLKKPQVKKLISMAYGVSIEEINKVINREENKCTNQKRLIS